MRSSKIFMTLVLAAMLSLGSGALLAQDPAAVAQPYVVKKGDSASSIAKRFYGKANLGTKLWQANRNLVAHPNRLTVGDTIYIFPEATLKAGKATAVPPPPMEKPRELYDRGTILETTFPQYFTFLADGRGLGGSGFMRIKVKKSNPDTGAVEESLFEAREVGEILASDERGGLVYNDGSTKAKKIGKLMLSTGDQVMVRFTEDLAKILDSDTYGDVDPYFREFPIYGVSYGAQESMAGRSDRGQTVGELYRFKGKLTIAARVEGLAPLPPKSSNKLKRSGKGRNQDVEPVSYTGRITYAVDAIELNDRVFIFIPLEPGPERVLEPPFVEYPDSYNSLGG